MAYNLGYVDTSGYNLGYVGAYTAYPYALLSASHGTADPNSIMAEANFASTDTVDLRIVSDFDPAKIEVDWAAFDTNQRWLDDINTLAEVTVNTTVDTTDTATIGWKTADGTTGQFTTTVNITEDGPPPPASVLGLGRRGFLRASVRGTVNSIIGSIVS